MSVLVVESLDGPELQPYRNLKHHVQQGADDFVVESTMVIERLLASDFSVHSLLLTPNRFESLRAQIPAHIPVFLAEKPLLSKIAGFDVHRGCLARAAAPRAQRSLTDALAGRTLGTVLLMEGLSDPANVGMMIRNAMAFGVDLIVSDPKGASPFSRRAARTSAGHIFNIPIVEHPPLDALHVIKKHTPSIEFIAATPAPSAQALEDFQRSGPVGLLVGNEGTGLSEQTLKAADHRVRIPMAHGVDSLNASASAAVFLYALNQSVSC